MYRLLISILVIMGSFCAQAFADNLKNETRLEDFGGDGVRTYFGRDLRSIFLSSCKVVIMGTPNRPVILVSVYDSNNVYSFWTHSPTFTTSVGYEPASATASDRMNFVTASESNRSVYSNLSDAEPKGMAELTLFKDKTGVISQVDVNFYSQQRLENRVSCRGLH